MHTFHHHNFILRFTEITDWPILIIEDIVGVSFVSGMVKIRFCDWLY